MKQHDQRLALTILTLLIAVLPGCATMFHRGPAEVRISGPDSMKVMTADSVMLTPPHIANLQLVIPPRGTDSLILLYRGKRHTAYLEKQFNPNTALNVLLFPWIGFGIDDLSQSWFDYHYLTVIPDSLDRLHVFAGSKEQTELYDRPRLLILGGQLLSWQSIMPGTTSPYAFHSGDYMRYDYEFGLGVDLYNRLDIFYKTRSALSSSYSYYSYPYGYGTSFGSDGLNGVAVRFIRDRVFLEGSYNWTTLHGYVVDTSNIYGYGSEKTKSQALVGIALGISGDISYLSLEYMMEPRPFYFYDSKTTYSMRRITLSYGANLRF